MNSAIESNNSLALTVDSFFYTLPDYLIASYPTIERTASKLMCLDSKIGAIEHKKFADILSLINPGDLLVLNNTKVIPARLFGYKLASGGKVEILIERVLSERTALAYVKASKAVKPGTVIAIVDTRESSAREAAKSEGYIEVIERVESSAGMYVVRTDYLAMQDILSCYGNIPLPPYMQRSAETADISRYQTVYSKEAGSIAAPTAGLHFDLALLQALQAKGVSLAEVTLHIGSGTFQPVRVKNIADHVMHVEQITVDAAACAAIIATKMRGGRVITVGTTATRAVETAAKYAMTNNTVMTNQVSVNKSGAMSQRGINEILANEIEAKQANNVGANELIRPYAGETNLFITPGYKFKIVDGMVTNFHLPCSTLLMLVCALAGRDKVLNAYSVAVDNGYRFYSYGDAMFVLNAQE